MKVELKRATVKDAELIWKMQIESFSELLKKYQDFETSPANETIDKVLQRLKQSSTYFYFIKADNEIAGAIRIVDNMNDAIRKRISPIFVLPKFRNMGIAQKAILKAEEIHGNKNWSLDTILQEKVNCYLYEKMGYRKTGKTKKINEKLTLVFYEK